MNLSGRLIDAFLALEETKRFAIAAERCYVSPSAFSQMITRLEAQVGARLFDRDTRNVALTPEGEIFSQGAHRIAAEINSSLTELRDRAQFTMGRVTIAAPPSMAPEPGDGPEHCEEWADPTATDSGSLWLQDAVSL